jgi:hypothetical protein
VISFHFAKILLKRVEKKIYNRVDLLPEPAARGGSGIRHQCSFGVAAELRRRNLIKQSSAF